MNLRAFCALIVAACVAASSSFAQAPPAAFDPCHVTGVERIVAVGDVHGAYDRFVAILRAAGLIDKRDRWIGGRTHLVQTGDVLDRGPDSRKALDLLRRLQRDAARAKGRVHALIGNHEAMRMLGDWRYVSAQEYAAFRTSDSESLRERFYQVVLAESRKQAEAAGRPFDEAALRSQLERETPLGLLEMRFAFAPAGEYGTWLREQPATARINGVAFVHGGLSPSVAAMGCAAINDTVRAELTADLEKTRATPLASLSAREDGPLWYRGLAQEDEAAFEPQVTKILSDAGATAIVVGHTVTPGRVVARFGGRVVPIDTGMLDGTFYPGGRPSALEIKDGVFTAIYEDRREPIAQPPNRTPAAAAVR